jgi:uncharacterized membrane protein YqjE
MLLFLDLLLATEELVEEKDTVLGVLILLLLPLVLALLGGLVDTTDVPAALQQLSSLQTCPIGSIGTLLSSSIFSCPSVLCRLMKNSASLLYRNDSSEH